MTFSIDAPTNREELLFLLRSTLEGTHRRLIYTQMCQDPCKASLLRINNLPRMSVNDFRDTCNKSIPIYITSAPKTYLLSMVLHNYIYRKWFRPYRSEIQYRQFLCKAIQLPGPECKDFPSQSTVDDIVSLKRAICIQVEKHRNSYRRFKWRARRDKVDYRVHVLQPLFRALLMVVCTDKYNDEDSTNVSILPVFLVRTGVEDGLSEPITFDSIRDKINGYVGDKSGDAVETTLETAIAFVVDLEAREAAVFGLQPDPRVFYETESFWWQKFAGDEPFPGSCSRFIDMDEYPTWQGSGMSYDSHVMVIQEQIHFRNDAASVSGELEY